MNRAALLLGFLLLGLGVARPLDLWTYQFFGFRSNWGLECITRLGAEVACTVAGLTFLHLLRRHREQAPAYALLIAGSHGLTQASKWLFHTLRPDRIDVVGGYAYPSGHTLTSVCVYGFLATRTSGWKRSFLWALPYLVALSRVVLGHHWLSDVLGGLLLGGVWLNLCQSWKLNN